MAVSISRKVAASKETAPQSMHAILTMHPSHLRDYLNFARTTQSISKDGNANEGIKNHGQPRNHVAEGLILEHAERADTDFLVYTGNFCGYCRALKNLLNTKELTFTEYNFDEHPPEMRIAVVQATGHRTVPVVFDLRGEQTMFIGGFDETKRYLK